ncbi:MAG: hypothetical protein FWD57_04635, partial [Polyangiaceae bacterium]|nr:hypothetical protein [Polyangiaceae bacterium]
ASQIQRLLKYMRFAVPINDAYLQPPHVTFSANLPLLGSGHTRQVAADMDFDCDGKRDIAVWEPPTAPGQTGTFRVWLSSKGFSNSAGQFVSRSFGQLGDIPVVAAMSGGCATDLAIFQPGGGLARNDPTDTQGYWQICYTGSNPLSQTCSGTSLIAFGDREDIPLPGLKFGTGTTRYLSVFRQRSSEWLWRSVSSSSVSSRQFTGTGLVPLPGLYDEDDLTDLAVFEPSTATFVMLMSNYNWNLIVSRVFSGDFVPQPNGTQLQRSGAIPLAGMNRIALLPSGSPTFPFLIGNRRVLSLYGPTNRTWATMWDPVGSGTIDTCNYGTNSLDIPISGIDINGDRNSDMVYFTSTNGATGTIYFKNSTPSSPNACNGSTISKSVSLSNWRKTKVFVVSDITGDGKPEILLFDPEAMNVRWLTSESGYTSYGSTTINVGGPRAILL